jgi:signal transduction histidine kinase
VPERREHASAHVGLRPVPSGLAARLAAVTAVLAVVLVLAATEIALSWSERSRLDDARREALAVGNTLVSYLTRIAPAGHRDSVVAAFGRWAGHDVSNTEATLYLVDQGRLVTATAVDSSLLVPPDALDDAAFETRTAQTTFRPSPEPTWRIALPLGGRIPFGVLDVSVSAQRLADWARVERRRAYALAIASALLVAIGVALLITQWVGRPLRHLGGVMAAAGQGAEWGPEAREIGPAEFRLLARRYNALRDALIRRERESEARAALLALEERARTLDRLAAMAETRASFAHEVGTPLNTVRGHLQLLRADLANAAAPTATRVDLLLDQVDRLTTIVRLGLERSAWPPPRVEAVDLRALAGRVLRFLEPSFAASDVTASVVPTTGWSNPVRARCDPDMVEQILLNLLKNAIEAVRPAGHVTVSVGIREDRAELLVSDNGPGLSSEMRAQLFSPFATTKGAGGTGLGLAVSRRLARAHDGDLELVPTPTGVTWRLLLPLAEPAPSESPP